MQLLYPLTTGQDVRTGPEPGGGPTVAGQQGAGVGGGVHIPQ